MNTMNASVMPSSDQLLHAFLARSAWTAEATNEFVLLSRAEQSIAPTDAAPADAAVELAAGTRLLAIRRSSERISAGEPISIVMDWSLDAGRQTFPWLELVFTCEASGERTVVTKGLCAPEVREGPHRETWRITRTDDLTCGSYQLEARFVDQPRRSWASASGSTAQSGSVMPATIPLGPLTVTDSTPPKPGR